MVPWAAILDEAVSKPGYVYEAYSRFYNFSVGNQFAWLCSGALSAVTSRDDWRRPQWKELGQHVKQDIRKLESSAAKRTRDASRVDAAPQ